MIALLFFVILCAAGVVYLLWSLAASDKTTARKLGADRGNARPPAA